MDNCRAERHPCYFRIARNLKFKIDLRYGIINTGFKNVTAGANPMILKQGMEKAVDVVVSEIKKMAKNVKETDVAKVATISAQDEKIGSLIAEALAKVGKDGVVTVEE